MYWWLTCNIHLLDQLKVTLSCKQSIQACKKNTLICEKIYTKHIYLADVGKKALYIELNERFHFQVLSMSHFGLTF